ncbi:MAG: hypothetical protein MK132_25135 [Lentisphaerales bacterium]|nr:hypothetical protein [Lentisphaerales bacterium]
MHHLQTNFSDREALITYVKNLAPWATGDASEITGGVGSSKVLLKAIEPTNYAKSRNFGDGKVTRLSPYISHGIIDINEIRNFALKKCTLPSQITKFIQELAWRDFWQRIAEKNPDWIWTDVENYKTGFTSFDYSDQLPGDILRATTGTSVIDSFINDLLVKGYIHNHARMYLASYIVHFRRVKWQAGAKWFLQHLLDADEASNNFSWQWIASTFSNRPYIFNLENVKKYFGNLVNCSPNSNTELDQSYDELARDLFPHLRRYND